MDSIQWIPWKKLQMPSNNHEIDCSDVSLKENNDFREKPICHDDVIANMHSCLRAVLGQLRTPLQLTSSSEGLHKPWIQKV